MQQQGWLCLRRASGALVLVCVTAVAGADTLPVAADGQINLAAPNVKGGALGTLSVASGRPAGDMKGLALFDLSALPPGAAVQKATLRMWVDAVLDPGPLDVLPILDPWREATLSASVAPRFGVSVASVPVAASNEGRYLNVDVTSLVQDWVSGASTTTAWLSRVAAPIRSASGSTARRTPPRAIRWRSRWRSACRRAWET